MSIQPRNSVASLAVLLALVAGHAGAEPACQLGILKKSTLSFWRNPATGQPWKVGDTYRFVFQTSASRTAFSPNIAEYNTWAQGLANASPLNIGAAQGVTWKVIGSTDTVDARDNTSTNPNTNGLGCPIFLLDGRTMVASNYRDLWDGTIGNPIRVTELGVEIFDAVWPFTGTYEDGTKATGKPWSFSALGGTQTYGTGGSDGRQINQGRGGWTGDWVWRYWTAAPPEHLQPMYAMSQVLTVIDDTVVVPSTPVAFTVTQQANQFNFQWTTQLGHVYDLLSHTNPDAPAEQWQVYADGTTSYGGMAPSHTGTKTLNGVQSVESVRYFKIMERSVSP